MMMSLGRYIFTLETSVYEEFQRNVAHRWVGLDRTGRRPARQYLGPGEDKIALTGTIHPTWNGGIYQLALMRAEAGTGEPRFLISAGGLVFGRWVIERVGERAAVFAAAGIPQVQKFNLSLARYGEDAA